VLDNLGMHHCRPVKEWLARTSSKSKSSICPVTRRS
jgi:hypothetical protein